MLLARLLTAAALLAAFIAALLLLERALFALLVGLVLVLAAREWAQLAGLDAWFAASFATGLGLLYAASGWALWPPAPMGVALAALFACAAIFWIALAPLWMQRGVATRERWLLRPVGVLALLPAALAMIALPPLELLLLFGLVWVADTAAYATGRAIGRRKLAPAISPGKTWEGAAGALVCVQAYAIACAVTVPQFAAHVRGMAWLPYLGAAALLWAVSIVGDLFESALKRQAAVKDSGSLLPGHGGVLDRIDSAAAVLPVGALLLHGMGLA